MTRPPLAGVHMSSLGGPWGKRPITISGATLVEVEIIKSMRCPGCVPRIVSPKAFLAQECGPALRAGKQPLHTRTSASGCLETRSPKLGAVNELSDGSMVITEVSGVSDFALLDALEQLNTGDPGSYEGKPRALQVEKILEYREAGCPSISPPTSLLMTGGDGGSVTYSTAPEDPDEEDLVPALPVEVSEAWHSMRTIGDIARQNWNLLKHFPFDFFDKLEKYGIRASASVPRGVLVKQLTLAELAAYLKKLQVDPYTAPARRLATGQAFWSPEYFEPPQNESRLRRRWWERAAEVAEAEALQRQSDWDQVETLEALLGAVEKSEMIVDDQKLPTNPALREVIFALERCAKYEGLEYPCHQVFEAAKSYVAYDYDRIITHTAPGKSARGFTTPLCTRNYSRPRRLPSQLVQPPLF